MDYLFFDMECSNGNDICSIGYVATDEKFNVVEQKDIIINPESRFVRTNRAGTEGITLAYKPEEFYAAPTFPHFYRRIKELLCRPDRTVVGFAVSNDAGFLKRACERYGLEQFGFGFFDVQRLDAVLHSDGNVRSLEKVLDFYGITRDESNVLHKSDDDAFFTLEILLKIIEERGESAEKIFETYAQCRGELKDGEIFYDGKNIINPEKMRKKDVVVFRGYCAGLEKEFAGAEGCLGGRKLSFDHAYESKNYSKMVAFANAVYRAGGVLAAPSECDMFVYGGKENSLVRRMKARKVRLITADELADLLGMGKNGLEKAAGEIDIYQFKKRADTIAAHTVK